MELQIGLTIRELRREKNLTQEQLASKLCTSQDTISLWECGKSYPDLPTLVKIAEIFNISTDYLLGLEA